MNRKLAALALTGLVALGTAACNDDTTEPVKGTVAWKSSATGGFYELQIDDATGKTVDTIVVTKVAWTQCNLGSQFPECEQY